MTAFYKSERQKSTAETEPGPRLWETQPEKARFFTWIDSPGVLLWFLSKKYLYKYWDQNATTNRLRPDLKKRERDSKTSGDATTTLINNYAYLLAAWCCL